MDLVVVIDVSNQVDEETMKLLKIYAKGIIDEYTFGENDTHASLITYDNRPNVQITLDAGVSRTELKDLVESVTVEYGAPRFDRAMDAVVRILNTRRADRAVPATVVVFSKGNCLKPVSS